ncbi:TIGR01906 family membrane protein [Arthrobacter glacialis]|uniref:TIGR01906 family membrane protein n=1 Tax=Arthrobacter glacialis TaxID=1664 RepID=UPI001FAFECA9|nr:TIGR01906 family membrane protein [Arthrobacter glacialis]
MSENPEHPDSVKSPAVGQPPIRKTADPHRDAVAVGKGAVSERAAARRLASTGSSATKIKLEASAAGEDSEPMRPASRFPQLPSDEEIAAELDNAAPASDANEPARDDSGVFVEDSPTTMIQLRPPAEEVAKRQAAREKAANTKPVLTRVFQVLIAALYPIVLLVLSIRLVTTSVFLWIEYHRPGFPADSFGFSTEDRLTYGSYTVDYLLNLAPPRYLGDLVTPDGDPLFLAREVGHMADVKDVIVMAFLVGLVLAIVMVIGMMYLSKKSFGGIRRALFAGSIATLALIVGLGIFAVTGWEKFFTEFHKIFFADGTWTFYTNDTLIRLFPSQFWTDSGIFIGAFVLIVSSLTLAFTWPTKDRRQATVAAQRPGRRTA